MPKPPQRFWNSIVKTVFPRFRLEDAANPQQFVGKTVLAQLDFDQPFEEIKIREIKGSLKHVKHFEINGTHWVSMFSFYTQLLEGRMPTPEEEQEFDLATQIKSIRGTDGKKKK